MDHKTQQTSCRALLAPLIVGCAWFMEMLDSVFTAPGALAYADVANEMMSSASTLSSMAQQFFPSLGVTVAALILHSGFWAHGAQALSVHDFTPAVREFAASLSRGLEQ